MRKMESKNTGNTQDKAFQRMMAYQKKMEQMVYHKRMNQHMNKRG